MEADWELEKLTGPDGEILYDLDGLGLAAADEPAPVRLLAPTTTSSRPPRIVGGWPARTR